MRTDVADLVLRAQRSFIAVPILRVVTWQPGYPDVTFDLTRYVLQMDLTLPPNFQPGYIQLTVENPNNVVSLNDLFQPDYVLDVSLGFLTRYGPQYITKGRFYIDEPQREFVVNPPQNQVIVQARDGLKLFMERNFEADEWVNLANMTVRAAIEEAAALATLAGEPVTCVFDTDAETTTILDRQVDEIVGHASDSISDVHLLMQDILRTQGLQAFFNDDGVFRVGMMRQTASVVTFGGVEALSRPIFARNHRRSGREHHNVVHVEGDRVSAVALDQTNIDRIGRRKYLYVDDPEIDTTEKAETRALAELDLAARFREQPDSVMGWQLDLERRDVITFDDEAASGLARGEYRVENIRYTYTAGQSPLADMQLGLGLPNADSTVTSEVF
jgi:hypothetical protein